MRLCVCRSRQVVRLRPDEKEEEAYTTPVSSSQDHKINSTSPRRLSKVPTVHFKVPSTDMLQIGSLPQPPVSARSSLPSREDSSPTGCDGGLLSSNVTPLVDGGIVLAGHFRLNDINPPSMSNNINEAAFLLINSTQNKSLVHGFVKFRTGGRPMSKKNSQNFTLNNGELLWVKNIENPPITSKSKSSGGVLVGGPSTEDETEICASVELKITTTEHIIKGSGWNLVFFAKQTVSNSNSRPTTTVNHNGITLIRWIVEDQQHFTLYSITEWDSHIKLVVSLSTESGRVTAPLTCQSVHSCVSNTSWTLFVIELSMDWTIAVGVCENGRIAVHRASLLPILFADGLADIGKTYYPMAPPILPKSVIVGPSKVTTESHHPRFWVTEVRFALGPIWIDSLKNLSMGVLPDGWTRNSDSSLSELTSSSIDSLDGCLQATCQSRILSLWHSPFLKEVGREFLLSRHDPLPSPDVRESNPSVLLMVLNAQLRSICNSLELCDFLQAVRGCRFLLGVTKSLLTRTKHKFIYEEDGPIQFLNNAEALSSGAKLLPFEQPELLSRRYKLVIEGWSQHYCDLLQGHICFTARCILLMRLCLAVLWLFWDVKGLILSSQLEDDDNNNNNSSTVRDNSMLFCSTFSTSAFGRSPQSSIVADDGGGGNIVTTTTTPTIPTTEVTTTTTTQPYDIFFRPQTIWAGRPWCEVRYILESCGRSSLSSLDRTTALQFLWSDIIAVMLMIAAIGLPFGLPNSFKRALTHSLAVLGVHESFLENKYVEELLLDPDPLAVRPRFCFLTGIRLDKNIINYCPACCAEVTSTEDVAGQKCQHCALAIMTHADNNSEFTYIQPEELYKWLKNNKDDIAIIDVRDDDYNEGGHIKNAKNHPSLDFNADKLADIYKNIKNVVFYCMYSQCRGPKAASFYASAKKNPSQNVYVLEGGFSKFHQLFSNDPVVII